MTGVHAQKKPWDTDCDATKAGLERFMRALIITGSHFTSSFTLAPVERPCRGVSVFFRVWIPEGREGVFITHSQCALKPASPTPSTQSS
jgi:hypothetical protein